MLTNEYKEGYQKTLDASDHGVSAQKFIEAVAAAFGEYDDRNPICCKHLSLNSVAEEFCITPLKARKLLITANVYSTIISRQINLLWTNGISVQQIMEITRLSYASIQSYLPYTRLPYYLNRISPNAKRTKLYRERKKAVASLSADMDTLLAGKSSSDYTLSIPVKKN